MSKTPRREKTKLAAAAEKKRAAFTGRRTLSKISLSSDGECSIYWIVLPGPRKAKWHRRLTGLKDLATSVSSVEHGVISVVRISIEATTGRRKFKLAGRNERARGLVERKRGIDTIA